MKSITASDRSALIRLAASLPVGDENRRAILNRVALGTPRAPSLSSSVSELVLRSLPAKVFTDAGAMMGQIFADQAKKVRSDAVTEVEGRRVTIVLPEVTLSVFFNLGPERLAVQYQIMRGSDVTKKMLDFGMDESPNGIFSLLLRLLA